MAIHYISHKDLRELFVSGRTAKIDVRHHKNILLILAHLDNATNLKNCQGVKNFHRLKGKRRKQYSVHVSGNMRITFEWDGTDVTVLDFEDYH